MTTVLHRGFSMLFMLFVALACLLHTGADGVLTCDGETPLFFHVADHRLKLTDLSNSIQVGDNYTSNACREACINYTQWLCLSFLYSASTHRCNLYKVTQQTDQLQVFIGLDYYEAYCSKPDVRPSRKLTKQINTGEKQIPRNFDPAPLAIGLSVAVVLTVAIVVTVIVVCRYRSRHKNETSRNPDTNLRAVNITPAEGPVIDGSDGQNTTVSGRSQTPGSAMDGANRHLPADDPPPMSDAHLYNNLNVSQNVGAYEPLRGTVTPSSPVEYVNTANTIYEQMNTEPNYENTVYEHMNIEPNY